jgi:hypothetical protein
MSQCRIWNKEKAVYDDLQKYDIDEDLCKVIKMKDFILESEIKRCCLELSRVVNPLDKDADYTIQVQFGVDNLDYKNRGRGRFLGIENLIEMGLFTEETMKEYVRQLARVIGKLHYVAQNDGYDLEVFVGKEDKIMLYIADFDLSNKILTYSSDEIYNMVWCLSAVPYFPTQDQPELYKIFVQEYLAIAEASGKREIAEKVIAAY